jgi:hypothetical protein
MKKKIVGVLICMLFLFSTLPVVNSADSNKNSENSLLKSDKCIIGFTFIITYGRIINHGLEYRGYFDGWCFNITPINLKYMGFFWDVYNGFSIEKEIITEDQHYIPQDLFYGHGFITKNYMFFCILLLN